MFSLVLLMTTEGMKRREIVVREDGEKIAKIKGKKQEKESGINSVGGFSGLHISLCCVFERYSNTDRHV